MPVRVYKAIDGTLFDTYAECVEYENKLEIYNRIKNAKWNFDDSVCGGEYYTKKDISNFVIANSELLRELLDDPWIDVPKDWAEGECPSQYPNDTILLVIDGGGDLSVGNINNFEYWDQTEDDCCNIKKYKVIRV